MPVPRPKNGIGIAALVLGLVGARPGPQAGRGESGVDVVRVGTSLGAVVLGHRRPLIPADAVDDAVDEIDSILADVLRTTADEHADVYIRLASP